MNIDPEHRKPQLIAGHDLIETFIATKHPKDIVVTVKIKKTTVFDDDDNEIIRLTDSMERCTGSTSKALVIDNEYLLFLFTNERDADEYIDYLCGFDEVLPVELWVRGKCVSEL